jgi:Holliday junction resolvase RusA-like endonuclease
VPPLVRIEIPGKPRTQGSMTLTRSANGHEQARYAEQTVNHRNLVVAMARNAWKPRVALTGDVFVAIVATFERPGSHYGTGRNAEVLKDSAPLRPIARSAGDSDKIGRLVLDALDIAGVYQDDSQVAVLRIEKRYADLGEEPGTVVEVWGS